MDDHRSERFGRYEILAELGRGAMGVVYKARDPKINRVVAVKTVSLEGQPAEEEREYRERFFREAEAAGRLSHPGIVTVYDVGEEPETRAPYIVMEFVGGQSLDKLLSSEDHKMPPETALQLTLELAEALDCAHGQGVVHRDLKPANILLTEDGHAKIADFGVAKLNLASHTLGGRVLGTPAYMSPEQLNGEAVDGRSDLFSLGVILYTVLTGYRPFQGNSALTVSFKVVNREPVPATVLNTDLPHGLDYIIGRAMAKDPAQRYQRGMEMVLDIQELRAGREPWSKTKRPGSAQSGDPIQTANAKTRSWPAGQRVVTAKPGFSIGALPLGRDAVEKLLEKMRRKSFVGAALLLLGLFVVAIRLGDTIWPQKLPARTRGVAALPVAGEIAPVKTAPAPAAPVQAAPTPATSAIASDVKAPKPTAKRRPKPVQADGARAPVMNAAPAAPAASASAILDVQVEHNFAEAHLSIWVDDRLTYTRILEGTDKKHLVVFHHMHGNEFHAMQISPGTHRVRVQVTSGVATDKSGTVVGKFANGQEDVLRISFDKHGEMNLSLQ